MPKRGTSPRISNDAVKATTGKTWAEWYAILDKVGAKKQDHPAMVGFVRENYSLGPWWEQMVVVNYEQVRGMRKPHEKPEGYEISVSKTFGVPLATLYGAWTDAQKRGLWLQDSDFAIRKATHHKSLRFTWVDGQTEVAIAFFPKTSGKNQVAVQHSKLPHAKAASGMKVYWAGQLACLEEFLRR